MFKPACSIHVYAEILTFISYLKSVYLGVQTEAACLGKNSRPIQRNAFFRKRPRLKHKY